MFWRRKGCCFAQNLCILTSRTNVFPKQRHLLEHNFSRKLLQLAGRGKQGIGSKSFLLKKKKKTNPAPPKCPCIIIEKRWNLYFDYVNAPQNGMPLLSISYKSSVLSPLLNRQSKSPNVVVVHVFFFNDKGKMGGNVCGNNAAASCEVSAALEGCG